MASIADVLQRYQDEYGFPSGDRPRIIRQVKDCFRDLVGAIPDDLFSTDWQYKLEPPIDLTAYPGSIYNVIGPIIDLRVIWFPPAVIPLLADDGTLSGRWLKIQRNTGNIVYRRIRKIILTTVATVTVPAIVIDEPWDNSSDDDLLCTVFTLEYPIPYDVRKFKQTRWSSNGIYHGLSEVKLIGPEQMQELRQANQMMIGIPSFVAPVDCYRIPTPKWTPTVSASLQEPTDSQKWGWSSTGVEHGSAFVGAQYGVAGTFSYVAVLVWGRRPWLHPTKGWGFLGPWIMSPPCAVSDQVTTTWGGSYIQIEFPNVDWVHGFTQDSDDPSKDNSGLEVWWFRARHATEADGASNHAAVRKVEADGRYYLWRITDPSAGPIFDRGDFDPVDIYFPLKDYAPQRAFAFDVLPSAADFMVSTVVVRPVVPENETEQMELPPEVDGFILVNRLAAMRQGRRERDTPQMKLLEQEYQEFMRRLNGLKIVEPTYQERSLGSGLGGGESVPMIRFPVIGDWGTP